MLKTATKIAIARTMFRTVRAARRVLGTGDTGVFVRGGITWNLDLSEGIDFSIFLLGAFEPFSKLCYSRVVRPGDVVLDIGANIGAHTLPLASLVGPNGRVIAFEPTQFAHGKLTSNLALNPELSKRVSVLQAMLVRSNGDALEAKIHASWPLEPVANLHHDHLGKAVSTSGASTTTLDDALRSLDVERIDLIKMDVDGNEASVLAGATRTLSRFRPPILMEIAPYLFRDNEFDEMVGLLNHFDYSFLDERTLRLVGRTALQLKSGRRGASKNVLAVAANSSGRKPEPLVSYVARRSIAIWRRLGRQSRSALRRQPQHLQPS